ncbi:MAG: NYN domain-containing protein [Candidatus Thermoplasmatota archaeon]|nr:NYN domain-containing protein [Candidatus Thermoplasmatota archaeon]
MKKSRQENQRIGVFVDVQNMYYSAKNLYKAKVNFKTLLIDAIAERRIIRAIAYVIKADVKDENTFYDALEEMGFEVKSKDLQVFYGGAKKGDWDVGIAMDVMRLAPKLDTVVLVSGDGDFSDLLEHAKSLGCRTEVLAFGKTTSHKLMEVTDLFIDLDKDKKYLLRKEK